MHPRNTSLIALLSISSLAHALNVSLPTSPPDSSKPLVSTLLAFSLEQDRWPDWAGTDAPNPFTRNALGNYARLTGTPPKIRVGANSEDHTVFSPTVTINENSFPPPNTVTPYPEATSVVVGDGYYQLSRFMLPGTQMTWGLDLGLNNVTNAVNMAKSIIKAFRTPAVRRSGVTLESVELGNEPDLYRNNGLRPSNWSVSDYVTNWEALAGPVAAAAQLSKSGVSFLGASFAGQGFTPTQIFNLGILDSDGGKTISTISQHRYSAAFCNGGDFPLISFMNKANVRGNLTVFNADIAATQQHGLRYIFGETGSIACHGAPGVSNTAGAALWVIDYTLQAATLGITEMFFHEGIGFKYNFFQPISLDRSIIDGSALNPPQPAQVQPSYYAGIVINTLIGRTGNAQIVELSVPDDNVSGYAAFEHGRLVRAVFVNLHAWLVSSTGERPSVHIDLDFAGGRMGRRATARRLVIGHADDTKGLTFAGQSFETSDASPRGRLATEFVDTAKGLDLSATEAVLISF
ncbi:glycoside hydrolase family 79 protein [Cristinia sonorae]|uniref:Glycoside hydrolase family 79 protein n=1 Tax=Cristinia sonorae TaxID=1940300 RepID=A0A8K0UZD4_9AGAR|nr:glycoside hydrolase family 79 protein [Cristinia sonorae]